MSNSFFNNIRNLLPGSLASGTDVDDKFDAVEQGFDLLEDEVFGPSGTSYREVDSLADLREASLVNGSTYYVKYHTSAGDGGGGRFRAYVGGTYVEDNGVTILPSGGDGSAAWVRDYSGSVNVRWFGARGDGSFDDTAAIQAALDTNKLVFVPPGKHRITSPLLFDPVRNRNSGLIGLTSPSNYFNTSQPGGPSWDGTNECVIYYDGSASDTTAIIHASAEPIGTLVDQTFANTVFGFRLENIVIDGNEKIGFGVYGIRLSEPVIKNVVVSGTTKHAVYVDQLYSGRVEKLGAFNNVGCGLSFGRGELDYGWASGTRVNGVEFSDLHATACGQDKAFDETTNPLWGYGVGLWLHRGNIVTQVTSENNDGPNIVFAPTSASNVFTSVYTELGNKLIVSGTDAITDGRATRQWGLWFVGQSGNVSLGNRVTNAFFAADGVKLTGTEPSSSRNENALSLENITGSNYLESDWGNYRLINCNTELYDNINGVQPTGAQQFIGGIEFGGNKDILDYYEVGSFTPALIDTGGTGDYGYAIANGQYSRIGNRIFAEGYIALNAVNVIGTGSLRIGLGTLPNVVNSGNYYPPVSIPYWFGLTSEITGGSGVYNQNYIDVWRSTGGEVATLSASEVTNTTRFRFSVSYRVI